MGSRHCLRTHRHRGRVKSPRSFRTDGISRSRTSFVRALLFDYYKPIIKMLILIHIYLSTQASTGGTAENLSIRKSSPLSFPSRPLITPSEANPDDAIASTIALDKSWRFVDLANSSIKVFSTHTGVLPRTLVGDESGVGGVYLVGRGGWREGAEGVKEGGWNSSGERRSERIERRRLDPAGNIPLSLSVLTPIPRNRAGGEIRRREKRKTERRRNGNHGKRRRRTNPLLFATYTSKLMIAFEMNQLGVHLRLHIMKVDQV